VIPDGVTSIGDGIFEGCYSLTNIDVAEDNQNYCSIDGNLYSKDGEVLVHYAIGKTDTDFTTPDSVTTISAYAFGDSESLTSITLGSSVVAIGDFAF
jgi:hypothetical protein